MKDSEIPARAYNPWLPMTDARDIKTIGKLGEELGECQAAVMRCLIQGIDEKEPETGYPNRLWLEDEVADVLVNLTLVIDRFGLDIERIEKRANTKKPLLLAWHEGAGFD